MIRFITIALTAIGLTACATPTAQVPELDDRAVAAERIEQRRAVVEYQMKQVHRVGDLMFPLAAANDELCPQTRPSLGIHIKNLSNVRDEFRPILQERYGMQEDGSTILHIYDGSPATGKLRIGDHLIRINDQDPAAVELKNNTPVEIIVQRNGVEKSAMISPKNICDYTWAVVEDPRFNAYADGQKIVVHTGVMNMVENDRQLAFVLAHELAHNAFGHIDAKKQNAMIGGLGGFLVDMGLAAAGVNTGGAFTENFANIGSISQSVAFEAEADYLALHFMARAGMDISPGVEDIWRRLSASNPASIDNAYTHPTNPERFLAIKKTRAEIQKKRKAGQPLIPNMKATE